MIVPIPINQDIPTLDSKPPKGSLTSASHIQHGNSIYRINTGLDGEYEVRTDILYPALRQMEAMLSYHNKVYQIRLESHSEHYDGEDNKAFTSMLRALIKWLKSKGHKRVAFFWVREKEKAKGYHYHAVLWLDGNKIQNPWAVQQRWEELHRKRGHSHPWRVRATPMIYREKPETQSKAVYVFSYLAKARGKGYGKHGSRDFSVSSVIDANDS